LAVEVSGEWDTGDEDVPIFSEGGFPDWRVGELLLMHLIIRELCPDIREQDILPIMEEDQATLITAGEPPLNFRKDVTI
jgi:hypothetical protein